MNTIGQIERITQNRVVRLFQQLGYTYLGNWENRDNRNIEADLLNHWLKQQGASNTLPLFYHSEKNRRACVVSAYGKSSFRPSLTKEGYSN